MATYTPTLNPSRGLIVEKNPFLKLDVDLVKCVLSSHDEVVIGIGSALKSHEPGMICTAGERMEITDHVLQSEGIDPARYILIPIEDQGANAHWVGQSIMVCPRWDTFYTRNFKNASMFLSHRKARGYNVVQMDQQKPEIDYFEDIAAMIRGEASAVDRVESYVPESAMVKMQEMGILSRVDTIYNRKRNNEVRCDKVNRILFLGGLRPPHGIWSEGNGHLGAIKQCLDGGAQVVIAVGSAQRSDDERCPFTAGQRIEMMRYAMLSNGVDATRFYIVPITDIGSNALYEPHLSTLTPAFQRVSSGNGAVLSIFKSYDPFVLVRSEVAGKAGEALSASLVRKTMYDGLRGVSSDAVEGLIPTIESRLVGALDPAILGSFKALKLYHVMHDIANRTE